MSIKFQEKLILFTAFSSSISKESALGAFAIFLNFILKLDKRFVVKNIKDKLQINSFLNSFTSF